MSITMSQIKKFGLGHSDIPTMYWNLSKLLKILSVNIDSKCKRIPRYISVLFVMVAAVAFYVYLVSAVLFLSYCLRNGDQILAMVTIASGISNIIGNTKLGFIFFYNKEIVNIIDDYILQDSKLDPNSRMYKNQLKALRQVKMRAMSAWIFITMNWFLYVIANCLITKRGTMQEVVYFGVALIIPEPSEGTSFIFEIIASYFIVNVTATVAALVITLTGCAEAQIIALSDEIYLLWDDVNTEYENHKRSLDGPSKKTLHDERKTFIHQAIKKRLEQIVDVHNFNISQIRTIEGVFRGAMAMELTLTLLGLITDLLSGLENTYPLIPFALIQVGLDCLAGQRLIDAGEGFEAAVYESKWENFEVSNMKAVLLILKESQKSLTLTAGGMTILDFRCFMSVLQTIYSAYTALRSTMN